MKSNIVLLICLLIILGSCLNNKSKVDSKKEIRYLIEKSESKNFNPAKIEKYLDSAYQKLLLKKNDSVTRNLYFQTALKYYEQNSLDKYLIVTKKINELAIEQNDSTHIAKSLYYLGDYYEAKTQLDTAFNYYNQSGKIYKQLNDTLNYGNLSLFKAGILYDVGNFTEGEIQGINALKLFSKIKNKRLIYESNVIIALCLKELNNYEKALEYFRVALNLLDQLENEKFPIEKIIKSRIACYNNMGLIYEKTRNYQEAIKLYNLGLKTKILKQKHPKLYAMLLNNLAYSKMKSRDLKGVENLLLESLQIRNSLQILPGIVASKIKLGEYYLYKKDTSKALIYLKESLDLAYKIKSNSDILQALKLLTKNDSKNKIYYSNLYIKVSDSIQNVERLTRNKFARIAYETETIEEQNQKLSKRNTYISSIAITLIFVFGIIFIFYRLKTKNKELLSTQKQQAANEKIYQLMLQQQSETEKARAEERNRIAMELHDGIVNSIFTTRFNLLQLEATANEKKEQLVKELEKAENEIRRVSHDLTQNLLFEDKTLPEILTNLIDAQKNQYNTKFDLSVDKYINWSTITSANKIHIYRIIQEAIQNTNKYSKAEKCFVMLLKTGDKMTIRIWDNGIGFNSEKVKYGIGLKNIKDRTKTLNGELKITSNKPNGTTIEIIF
nr:ATP-binding protein [uncultured Flavobacterium sp.]